MLATLQQFLSTVAGAVVFFAYTLSFLVDREFHTFLQQQVVRDVLLTLLLPLTLPVFFLSQVSGCVGVGGCVGLSELHYECAPTTTKKR